MLTLPYVAHHSLDFQVSTVISIASSTLSIFHVDSIRYCLVVDLRNLLLLNNSIGSVTAHVVTHVHTIVNNARCTTYPFEETTCVISGFLFCKGRFLVASIMLVLGLISTQWTIALFRDIELCCTASTHGGWFLMVMNVLICSLFRLTASQVDN